VLTATCVVPRMTTQAPDPIPTSNPGPMRLLVPLASLPAAYTEGYSRYRAVRATHSAFSACHRR
jgi:hypothetical protein